MFGISVKPAPKAASAYDVASSASRLNAFQQKLYDIRTTDSPTFSFRALFPNVVGPSEQTNEQTFADVKLDCGEKVFNCHRLILAGKSSLFERMFANSGFSESAKAEVKITDVLPDTMEDILRFIYCGYIETDMTKAADDVEQEFLYSATKYDLSGLIDLLMLAIKDKLTAKTVCQYLLIADRFELKSLKIACYDVLTRHSSRPDVIKSAEWAEVLKRPALITELYSYEAQRNEELPRFGFSSNEAQTAQQPPSATAAVGLFQFGPVEKPRTSLRFVATPTTSRTDESHGGAFF